MGCPLSTATTAGGAPETPYNRHFFGGLTLANLLSSLVRISAGTTLSRVLGFVRDVVLARVFGADDTTDAFFVAFKIPNFLRRLFAEGAFAVAFVPVLTEYRATRSVQDLKRLVDRVAGTLGVVLLAVSLAGVIGAPFLMLVFAPGWASSGDESFGLAVEMLRLTFPYLLFISLTAFAGGILNAHDRFGVPAFTPVLLNLVLIACALWLSPHMATPVTALAWGVLFAGVAQFAFQLPFLHQLQLVPRFTPAPRDPSVRRILRQMTPAVLGVSVTQINLLVDTVIATFLAGGSISGLYYSDRLVEFPVGVLGVALGTLILPGLAQRHVAAAPAEFSRLIDWGLRWVVLLGLPAMTGLIMLAGPVISTLFQSDVFDARDVHMASRSLVTYAVGLLPFLLVKVLAPGFFARQDSRTPVRFAMLAVLVNLCLSLLLMRFLQHAGLALATSLAAAVNAGLLFRGLRRGGVYRPSAGWPGLLLKAAFGSAVMGLFALLAAWPLDDWTTVSLVTRAWRLAAIVCAAVTIYFGTLWLLGVRMTDFDGRPPAAVR
mgnify:CR=1 FL=1